MKRIGYLNILGEKWSVFQSDSLPENIDGLTTFQTRTIEISTRLSGDSYTQCLWHEFGHCVMFELGMYLTNMNLEVEELLVDTYAKSVVKNQKELAKMIKAGK